jgi:hypothetical protein
MANAEVQKRSLVWHPQRDLIWTDAFSNLLHLLR